MKADELARPFEAKNTDTEIYRKIPDDYYSPSISKTADNKITICVGGLCITKPVEEWHALNKRVEELESKPDYPHEEIADMQSRIASLEGVIDNLTRMVDTPEFKQTLAAIQGDNDWVTFSVFNPLGNETKCEVGDWLETLIESLPEARTALAGKGGE